MNAINRDDALAAIRACARINLELDPLTGNEDPVSGAYVEGVRAAHDAVAALPVAL